MFLFNAFHGSRGLLCVIYRVAKASLRLPHSFLPGYLSLASGWEFPIQPGLYLLSRTLFSSCLKMAIIGHSSCSAMASWKTFLVP